MSTPNPQAIQRELVAGVVRQIRFAERALLADEPVLAARYLNEADVLLTAARNAGDRAAIGSCPDTPTP